MKFLRWLISSLLILILQARGEIGIDAATKTQCKLATKGFKSSIEILIKSTTTIYNVFPIRIGGVEILNLKGLEDYNAVGKFPACVCIVPPAIPRVGIKIALWEPIAIVEPTALPYCSPVLGTDLPINFGLGSFSVGGSDKKSTTEALNTYQTHYIKFPTFKLLQLFMDFVCLDLDASLDLAYLSEVDPTWQNDAWATILGPEAFLVSNPVAQFSCMADAIASTLGFPLDPLWWCFGTWGSAFPLSENVKGGSNIVASGNIVARTLLKMHRQLLLWGSVGEAGLCKKFPMPVMRKSQYGVYPIFPIGFPKRFPIGRAERLWAFGQDVPAINMHVYAWIVYRKRDCCAF